MDIEIMIKKLSALAAILLIPVVSSADPIKFEVGPYTSPDGQYSASFVHTATHCPHASKLFDGTSMMMCGEKLASLDGTLYGLLNDNSSVLFAGLLTATSIANSNNSADRYVLGAIGDAIAGLTGNRLFGFMVVPRAGIFLFENFNMGAGLPNSYDGNEIILWGQNISAYCASSSEQPACRARATKLLGGHKGLLGERALGIDLYAKRVPEPGTMALLGLGLLGLGIARRRRVS